jgi:hypothetical protein
MKTARKPPCPKWDKPNANLPRENGKSVKCGLCGAWTTVVYNPETPEIVPRLARHEYGGSHAGGGRGSRRSSRGSGRR